MEQISRKIDLLQELFDKQQINLDLKNLNLNQVSLPFTIALDFTFTSSYEPVARLSSFSLCAEEG